MMSDFLTEMREFVSLQLKAHAIESEIAESVSENLMITFRRNYGGIPIYIHKSENHIRRNAEIYQKFNGKNTQALCREYNLSYQQICKILKAQRTKKRFQFLNAE